MAIAREFDKCALVMGILSTSEDRHSELIDMLESRYGKILSQSEIMDFPYTDYYDAEMSGHPVRYLLMFEKLVDPSELADIKIQTNELEKHFSNEAGRRINIDPGILSLANFILATCKDRSHRIPLKNGVYGEVTLIYQDKDFQRLPWTYADYSSDDIKATLRKFRELYKKSSRSHFQN